MILQPEEWDIKIWKENNIWHLKYIEYVSNTKQNREFIDNTLNLITNNPFMTDYLNAIYIKKIEKDNMIGIELFSKETDFKKFADQLTSEFIFWSNFGDMKFKDMFEFLLKKSINVFNKIPTKE